MGGVNKGHSNGGGMFFKILFLLVILAPVSVFAGITSDTSAAFSFPDITAGIKNAGPSGVQNVFLTANPNPFSGEVRLEMSPSTVLGAGNAEFGMRIGGIVIYDCNGKLVYSALSTPNSAFWTWDGMDKHGVLMPSGFYFVRLTGKNQVIVHKILLMR